MKAGELPIYKKFPDENTEYVLTPRENSSLRNYLLSAITPTRRSIQEWYTTAETNTQKTVKCLVENSLKVCDYVREDPVVLARGGFVTVCGLGGLVLGSKGGVLRQAVYGTLSTGVGFTVCYPSVVSSATKRAWDSGTRQVGRFPYGHSPFLAHQGLIVVD
nr:unnamed protein product [Spirometra erinaceieuropaei]